MQKSVLHNLKAHHDPLNLTYILSINSLLPTKKKKKPSFTLKPKRCRFIEEKIGYLLLDFIFVTISFHVFIYIIGYNILPYRFYNNELSCLK